MTLGQRISTYRKSLGISQEELGARLGVSRQAVSKWETDAAAPDMANLLALAREFGVSVAELTQTPEEPSLPRRNRLPFLLPALVLATIVGGLFWVNAREHAGEQPPPATPPPVQAPNTDFALVWDGPSGKEWLALGVQESFFPFGTSLALTEPEEVLDTDFHLVTAYHADCGAITVDYVHIEEDLELDPESPERESIDALSTIAPGIVTPRDIGPGSPKSDVLAVYGDELIYCLKEDGGYSLVPHEYFYAYAPAGEGAAILFYMADGLVTGVALETLGEMPEAYEPNNLYRFPMKNGEPDFSLRQEPEREDVSDTRKVYIAFNQLVTNNNLSAEERYGYRRDVFGLLPEMDWQEYGALGSSDSLTNMEALLFWLANQESYSPSELLWIQMGCVAKGLDGAITDMYCNILSHVFFYDPVGFAKKLATDGVDGDTMYHAIRFTAYDADLYPNELQIALDTLNAALEDGSFTEAESGWAELLILHLTTDIDSRNELPKTP